MRCQLTGRICGYSRICGCSKKVQVMALLLLSTFQNMTRLMCCRPNVHISGVSFSHDGRQLFASYTNEQIYSFSCKQHQRVAAYFEAPDPAAHATRWDHVVP